MLDLMNKRKLLRGLFAGLLAAVVLGLFGFGVYKLYKHFHPNKNTSAIYHLQSKAEIEERQKSTAGYDDILIASNKKDYKKVIELAQSYGKNSKNAYTERLNGYMMCMQAAVASKNDAAKKTCYDLAKSVANGLDVPQEKTYWIKMLDDTYDKTGKS